MPTCIARKAINPTPAIEYDRADQPVYAGSLADEWREIVEALLPD